MGQISPVPMPPPRSRPRCPQPATVLAGSWYRSVILCRTLSFERALISGLGDRAASGPKLHTRGEHSCVPGTVCTQNVAEHHGGPQFWLCEARHPVHFPTERCNPARPEVCQCVEGVRSM